MRANAGIAKTLAAGVAVALCVVTVAPAEPGTLRGAVVPPGRGSGAIVKLVSAESPTPLARVCGPDGTFELSGVPSGTYRVAVETPEGQFPARLPVVVPPGGERFVRLELRPGASLAPAAGTWHDPWYSAMIVVGAAIVVGLAAEALTEDGQETPASPD